MIEPVQDHGKDEDRLSDDSKGNEANGQNGGDRAVVSCTRMERAASSREEDSQAEKERSLRDIAREAYSQSSLHNYKSDPLNRRRIEGRGRDRRTGVPSGRGKGQPNMKLRIEVMLEKIKRDFS